MKVAKKWIGVDLDGTLASYDGWKGVQHIGEPIEAMAKRVRIWVENGTQVRIFTARVAKRQDGSHKAAKKYIQDWCLRHFGRKFAVTCIKDGACIAIYDDRAFSVQENTGHVFGYREEPR